MFWWWFGFVAFIILVIGGTFALKFPLSLRIRYFIYELFIDAFYISAVYGNKVCQLIFGGLWLVISFVNLSMNFIQSNKKDIIKRVELAFDFIIVIGLTIYLLYIIPNEKIQEIAIVLISAVYGGLLTLIGVVLTIKSQAKQKMDDEIKKAKPWVFIYNPDKNVSRPGVIFQYNELYSNNCRGTLENATKEEKGYILPDILISNSDYSYCVLIGYRINDLYHLYDYGQVLSKNEKYNLKNKFKFKFDGKITYCALLLMDMLDNIYELELNYTVTNDNIVNHIKINSGIETKPTDLPINPKEI